jgi:hypothetical protein
VADGSERSCGGCTLCCTLLRVDELPKLGGVPCAQLVADGCGIHPRRPAVCRAYRCMWLQGALDEEDRPDRLGAVLDVAIEAGAPRLRIVEAAPGVFDASPRLRAIAERYREQMPVKLTTASRSLAPDAPFRVLLAGGEERRVAGERVEIWRGGALERCERLAWPQRVARRGLHAWQAWRLRRRYARPSEYMPRADPPRI